MGKMSKGLKLSLIICGPIWVALAAYLVWTYSGDNPPQGAGWAGLMTATAACPLIFARELWRTEKAPRGPEFQTVTVPTYPGSQS
jgi:hypothetical protein